MALGLKQLQYCVAVAEEEQLTRAARRLHVAQPALSRIILQVESELGVELFERHPRGVTPTPAGEAFLEKARRALAASSDVLRTAESLARAASGKIEVGFIGPPPMLNAPELFVAFADAHPEAEISFRGLPFPTGSTMSWLKDVDVAFSHPPASDAAVRHETVRAEPRVLLAPQDHPLARRSDAAIAEVLDDTYISYHPTIQQAWAGFHSLDDHRDGPPAHMTTDYVLTPLDILATMAAPRGVTTLPACDAAIIQRALPGLVAIPLRDASPAMLSLTWRAASTNSLVDALVAAARHIAEEPQVNNHVPPL
jgi:DNA-binding transcriptional LysR family regulator